MANFDLIVIGSGPGGYVAAIKASQLGYKTAVVERAELGGICLNWGCIPTKSLIKSAQVYRYMQHSADYGVVCENYKANFEAIIARSRNVAETMSKGIQFLFKKNNIEVLHGHGKVLPGNIVEVQQIQSNILQIISFWLQEPVLVYYPIFHKTERKLSAIEKLLLCRNNLNQ